MNLESEFKHYFVFYDISPVIEIKTKIKSQILLMILIGFSEGTNQTQSYIIVSISKCGNPLYKIFYSFTLN